MNSNYIISKLQISEDLSLMAMIDNNTIHFFDERGNNVERGILKQPEVFVLNFIEGENRRFVIVNEGEQITQGDIYVINKDNQVVFVSSTEENYDTFIRITDSSIILGVKEKENDSLIMMPVSSSGRLIDDNQLTNKKLIGIYNRYYLFSEESENISEYDLYALRPQFYDTDKPALAFVRKFHADFLILWKSNVIYYNGCENSINIKPYGDGGYHWDSPDEQTFKIEENLKNVNWAEDVQILYDKDSIILHHTRTSSNYNGFTIVFEQIGYGKFKLCNQSRLSRTKIRNYANSLIKFNEGLSGISIYDRYGNKIAKTEDGYDYVKNRAHITDYAVLAGNLSVPKMRSPFNTNIRVGVISTDDLELVISPNFNKVDFIVLEESSKAHYREKGKYEIYIKVAIETVNKHNELIEIWGLYKHSECVIPCFYKSIDVLRIKSNFVLILEQHDGLKGIFYNDRILTQCIYEKIEELGNCLVMYKPNGLIDVLHVDKEYIRLYENLSSITAPTIKLDFLKNIYTANESIIISKNNKYGLIYCGELVVECIYDEIRLINAYPSLFPKNPLWFVLQKGDKKGLYGTENKVWIDTIYNNVNVIDWRTYHRKRDADYNVVPVRELVLELDGKYYTSKEQKLICDNDSLIFRGFVSSTILVFSDDEETCLKFYTHRGEECGIAVFDSDGDCVDIDDIESLYSGCYYAVPIPIAWINANIKIDFQKEIFVFSFEENAIFYNPLYKDDEDEDDDSGYYYSDDSDDYDYERETYYALGGEDYDEWRNKGGNLDDMMDGLGF